jgi:hypothetical protein
VQFLPISACLTAWLHAVFLLTLIAAWLRAQANTYSWAAVQTRLAERLDAVVVSHDMPGFGLTQRSAAPAVYCAQPPVPA